MTSYRLMDGVNGRPGVGSSGTQPPASPTAFSGNYIAGLTFRSTGTVWLQGYWWYVPAGGDTGPVKFALWQLGGASFGNTTQGTLVPGSAVTSGTLTAGQFNFVSLTTPLLLSNSVTAYVAAVGFATTIGFPETQHQFSTGNPYPSGITNGPVTMPATGSFYGAQMPFSTAGSDPSLTMPATNDQDDNLWLDIQVTDTPPAGATYRLWPNLPYALGDGTNGGVSAITDGYTMAIQFSLSHLAALSKIWFYSGTSAFGATAAAALPGRCAIWDVNSQAVVTGTDNASPAWKKPDGSAGAAGGGWLYCDYSAAGIVLNASQAYKAAVWYAGGATWRTVWAGGGSSEYWGTGGSVAGPGISGITMGILSAPSAANATPYQESWSGPNLAWAYPGSQSHAENDWIDLEVYPVNQPTATAGGRMMSRSAETYRYGR